MRRDPMKPHDLLGTDVEWFACDAAGSIAYLLSNGTLAVPPPATRSKRELKQLRAYFSAMAPSSETIRVFDVSRVKLVYGPDEFFKLFDYHSLRGLYTYSAEGAEGGQVVYELHTRPTVPLSVDNLAVDAGRVLSKINFREAIFGLPSFVYGAMWPDA